MSRAVTWIAISGGALVLLLGLLFLCAAVQQPQRLVLALVLLLIGGGITGAGIWQLLRQRELAPDALDDQVTALAKGNNGEITQAQIVASLHVPDEAAQQALDLLESRGEAQREWREDRAVYVFPGLRQSRVQRRCAYCHSEFSVAQPLTKCPNCGSSNIELVRD